MRGLLTTIFTMLGSELENDLFQLKLPGTYIKTVNINSIQNTLVILWPKKSMYEGLNFRITRASWATKY
jgi:hypothetical protein